MLELDRHIETANALIESALELMTVEALLSDQAFQEIILRDTNPVNDVCPSDGPSSDAISPTMEDLHQLKGRGEMTDGECALLRKANRLPMQES
jgi:hypothetical protein